MSPPVFHLRPPGRSFNSARRAVDSTLAPSSIGSTQDHGTLCSTLLPYPIGSTLVICHPACAVDYQASRCSPALDLFGSIWLRLPCGFTLVLVLSASILIVRRPGCISGARHCISISSSRGHSSVCSALVPPSSVSQPAPRPPQEPPLSLSFC